MDVILYRKQREVLEFLRDFINAHGYAPTVREIAKALGVSSSATVAEHLQALEQKKVIKRMHGKRRGLALSPSFEKAPAEKIPVLGQIAAGHPLEAIGDRNSFVEFIPTENIQEIFALRVRGNSMVEDGILDGDFVIIRRQATCQEGEVVVALLPDGNATLKRLYHEKTHIRLQPANSDFQPIFVADLQIQGKVVGVVRRF